MQSNQRRVQDKTFHGMQHYQWIFDAFRELITLSFLSEGICFLMLSSCSSNSFKKFCITVMYIQLFSLWRRRQLWTFSSMSRGLKDNFSMFFSHGTALFLPNQLSNLYRWNSWKFLGSLLQFIIPEKIHFHQLKEKLVLISITYRW